MHFVGLFMSSTFAECQRTDCYILGDKKKGETRNRNAYFNHRDLQPYKSSNINIIFMWYVCFVSHEGFHPAVPLFKTELGLKMKSPPC